MQMTVKTHRKTLKNSEAEHAFLNRRDLQLAQMVTTGRLNKEISYELGITEGTVKVYMSHLFAKLGLSNRAELAAWAVRNETLLARPEVPARALVVATAERAPYQMVPPAAVSPDCSQSTAWQN